VACAAVRTWHFDSLLAVCNEEQPFVAESVLVAATRQGKLLEERLLV
jgi:hypothetical protein